MNPVGWFEIPVKDISRATKFYEDAFKFKMNVSEAGPMKMATFPNDEKGMGASGSLVKADSYVPSMQGSTVYFSVEDIDLTLARITKEGGRILQPKTSIGKWGYIAHFEDTEGNRVSLHCMK